jgi:hypothetical protein
MAPSFRHDDCRAGAIRVPCAKCGARWKESALTMAGAGPAGTEDTHADSIEIGTAKSTIGALAPRPAHAEAIVKAIARLLSS